MIEKVKQLKDLEDGLPTLPIARWEHGKQSIQPTKIFDILISKDMSLGSYLDNLGVQLNLLIDEITRLKKELDDEKLKNIEQAQNLLDIAKSVEMLQNILKEEGRLF
jgi:hypothetical protein